MPTVEVTCPEGVSEGEVLHVEYEADGADAWVEQQGVLGADAAPETAKDLSLMTYLHDHAVLEALQKRCAAGERCTGAGPFLLAHAGSDAAAFEDRLPCFNRTFLFPIVVKSKFTHGDRDLDLHIFFPPRILGSFRKVRNIQ